MNESDQSFDPRQSSAGATVVLPTSLITTLRDQLWPAVVSVLLLTLVTGAIFPLALLIVAPRLFPGQAEGSLVTRDGIVIGSELIGQRFTGPEYFHPRPSAAGRGYDAASSGGTNLGPANPKLRDDLSRLAAEYRRRNGLPPKAPVPIDAVTRSASGLDPHISPANAALQVPRVARVRGLGEEAVRRLVADQTQGRQLGFLGEPRVAVLQLNLEFDRAASVAPHLPGR